MERTFDAKDEQLHEVISFIEEGLEQHDAGMKDIMAVTVAVEEMFVNVAHYAYEGEEGYCTVSMRFTGNDVEITLKDKGIPFDPLAKEDPDIGLSAEERAIGGLGIYMVKNTMDECSYVRDGDENIFTMKKTIRK